MKFTHVNSVVGDLSKVTVTYNVQGAQHNNNDNGKN